MRSISHMESRTLLDLDIHDDLTLRIRKAGRREGISAEELIMKSIYHYLVVSEAAFLQHKYADHFTDDGAAE